MMRTLTMAVLLAMLLAGCETFKGVGRDVQKAGNWIEDTANK